MTDDKLIKNLGDLVGKTITKATEDDYDNDTILLAFSDNTYSVIKAEDNYGSISMYLTGEVSDEQLRTLDIITEAEYSRKREEEMKKQEERRIKREKEVFKELKAKYEGVIK